MSFGVALGAESVKISRSSLVRLVTVLLAVLVPALGAGLLAAAGHDGSGQLATKARLLVPGTGWEAITAVAGQLLTVTMLLGAGFVVSWTFGREFTDQTVETLLSSGPSRRALSSAKILSVLAWATLTTALAVVTTLALGGLLGLHGDSPGPGLVRLGMGGLLSALLAVPFSFVASAGRSALAGVGAAVGMIMVTQLLTVFGTGAWFPYAAPGLWLGMGGPSLTATPVQLLLVLPVAGVGWLGTALWWTYAEL